MIKTYRRCEKTTGCGLHFDEKLTSCPKCGNPDWATTTVKLDPSFYVFDIETYPNLFSIGLYHFMTDQYWSFECSPRRNDLGHVIKFLQTLHQTKAHLIGFNNQHFDYPVIHFLINNFHHGVDHRHLYDKAQQIITSNDRWGHIVWPDQELIKQIDLFKIMHFDNNARSTSLKIIEFNMEADSVQDLPFPVGTMLTDEQKDVTVNYMKNDVMNTADFALACMDKIQFRQELGVKLNKDFLKHNDTKIGKDFFIMELEKHTPNITKEKIGGRTVKRQTIRDHVNLNDVILPSINFSHPEFIRVNDWLKQQTITETKGVFKGLSATVDGFTYDFGTGGIHGSIESSTVVSDDKYAIIDIDVASYYPNLAIANRFYPEHLGETFCDIYLDLYNQRKGYDKKRAENGMLKLALNGVYGDSANEYSPFLDIKYTMSITVNGQLLLCLLADYLRCVRSLKMIQINTDGLTFKLLRSDIPLMREVCKMWERLTKLELEEAEYSRMFIRDVNSYIAEKASDKSLKRKGAYCHLTDFHHPNSREVEWHKDHSALIVPKAAEAVLVRGEDLETFITNHEHSYDFMLRTKPPKSNKVIIETEQATFSGMKTVTEEQQRVTRYYVSKTGGYLFKVAPPVKGMREGDFKKATGVSDHQYHKIMSEIPPNTWDERIHTKNKSKYKERKTAYCKGWKVTECNDLSKFERGNVDYGYYIAEAQKLITDVKKNVI